MFKRYVAIFTVVIFFITLFPIVFPQKVHAYQNNSYFSDLKVGLVSMSSTSITLTLNGNYTLNGQVYPSGSVISLGISGTSITMNGTSLSQFTLTANNSSNLLTITSGPVSNKYMGSFLFKILNGKILPINTIDTESYLKGVVGYEMADNFPIESLKAQTVAARNYALSRLGWESAKGYDFDDTASYQVYKGFNASYTNVISAVDQTRGQVLLYNNALVETLYSAWHGGVSEDSENVWGNYVPYLRSVQDSFESNPWPNGNIVLNNSQIQATLVSKGYLAATDSFQRLDLSSIIKYTSGRIANINIVYKNSSGSILTKSVTKDNTRTFLALPSNLYTATYDSINGTYTFSGKGNGHGLGMSQIGAKNRAAAGQTYDQILKFYYQNVTLQNLILKATITNFTQSTNSLLIGNAISFNTTAGSGNGFGYLFKYVVKNGSTVIFTKDYDSTSNLDYIPDSPGNYTIESYVKDKFSISDYDDKKTSSFSVFTGPVLNSFTTNKTDTLVGQDVSSNIDVQSGSGSYLYKYEVSKDAVVLTTRDFLSDKTFIYTPSLPGNYTMTAYVKDALSNKAYDFKQTQNFTAYNSLSYTFFTKDVQNVFSGDTVNFNSGICGGSGKGINYKYVVIKDGQSIYTRDYSSSSQFSYIPTIAGNYEVDVYALDAVSSKVYDAMSSMNFTVNSRASLANITLDKSAALVNDTITINANGSTSGALYKYVISKDGVVILTKDYSLSSSTQYVPVNSGNYQIQVFTKNSLSLKDYDDTKLTTFTVYQNPVLASFTINKLDTIVGQGVSANVNVQSGSGSYVYKYEIAKDGVVLTTKDFSSDKQFNYIPSQAGIYTMTLYIKDAVSSKIYDLKQTQSFTAYDALSLSSFIRDDLNVFIGDAVTFTTSTNGGSNKGVSYKYVVIKDGEILLTRDFSSSNKFIYVPNVAGNFEVDVYAVDAKSDNSYDLMSKMIFSVKARTSLSSLTVDKNTSYINSAFTINAVGSNVGSLYKFVVSKDGSTIYTKEYDTASTLSFVPTVPGIYQVQAFALDLLSIKDFDDTKSIQFTALSDAKIKTAQTNKLQYLAGQTINLSAVGSSGSGNYLYKYVVSKNGIVLSTYDYGTSGNLLYKVDTSGTYTITIYLKDAIYSESFEDMKVLNIPVYSLPTMTYSSSQSSALVGQTINYSINASNGSGNFQYKFVVIKDGSLATDTGFSNSNAFAYSPLMSGNYQVLGYVKDALSESAFDVQGTLALNVYNPQLTTVNLSGYFYEGKAINFQSASAGVSPSGFSYRYEVISNGTIVTSTNYSSLNSFAFTPSAPGSYTIKAYGKDAISTNAYDSMKQFSITISSKPLYFSSIPISYGMTSNDVISLQNALIKLGYPISSATGYFGTQTKSAVISFQVSRALTGDGVVGNMTYGSLNDALIEKAGIKTLSY